MKLLNWATGPLVALLMVAVFVAMAPSGVKDAISDFLSGLNPLHEETVDRTGPPVLNRIVDLSEYHAASGYFEVVVDKENDSKLPSWVKGERVLYVGKGEVDALVDFSELDERRIEVVEDGMSVSVKLPPPVLDEPALNLKESYVVEHSSGIASKFGGSDLERQVQLEAVERIADAAAAADVLDKTARENTVAMLRGLLGALGYANVTVIWDDEPAPSPTPPPTPR